MPGSSALSLMPRSLSCSSAPNVRLNGIAWIRRQIPWSVLLIWGRPLVAKNILPIMLNSNQFPYNGHPLRTSPPVICFILASSGSLTGRADLEREPRLFKARGLQIDGLRQTLILKGQTLNTSNRIHVRFWTCHAPGIRLPAQETKLEKSNMIGIEISD